MDDSEGNDLSTLVQDHVERAVASTSQKLLSDFDALITARMTNMQAELTLSQSSLSNSQLEAIKNIKSGQIPTFKKKGNEVQYMFNSKVQDELEIAKVGLNPPLTERSLSDAKVAIDKGIEQLKSRQKLIRLADKSEAGWTMAAEYETNDLAEDSDDERRINRADACAMKKLKDSRSRKSKQRQTRLDINSRTAYPLPGASGFQRGQSSSANQNTFPSARRGGVCFGCGKAGHYRFECGAILAAQNKMSTHNLSNNSDCVCLNGDFYPVMSSKSNSSDVCCDSTGSPVGRLRRSLLKWEEVGANDHVLDIIRNGYKLPLIETPPVSFCQNNKSSLDNADFVSIEVKKLLSKGCISIVKNMPKVVNPLTVACNGNGKKRLVLDCRVINLFLFKFGFKLDDIEIVKQLFQRGDYLFTFDLKSAYHHIEICLDHRTYLGFAWPPGSESQFYVFNVLPFGISTAAYIFTKVVRVMVAYWRSQAFRVAMYMDDGCGGSSSLAESLVLSNIIQKNITDFGFLLAAEKCQWSPSNIVTWLGHVLDMKDGIIMVTDSRIQSLLVNIAIMVSRIVSGTVFVEVRKLASIVGKIISMHTAIGPIVQLRTRCLYNCIETRSNWKGRVQVDSGALDELLFWQDNACRLNGRALCQTVEPSLNAYSDASAVGYGGFVTEEGKSERTGLWTLKEQTKSSTWREIEAVSRVVDASKSLMSNKVVKWHTDSQNVARILNVGSKKPHLHSVALKIYDNCQAIGIKILPEWIPRELNGRADELSKRGDCDDWGISEKMFSLIDSVFGPHTVDRFACEHNRKLTRFNSKWHYETSEAVDAFAQSWKNENNWLVPPPRLVVQSLRKLESESACGTLVVPEWRSAAYWPLLCCDYNTFRHFVKGYLVLDANKAVVKGKGDNGIFANSNIPFNMLVARVCF